MQIDITTFTADQLALRDWVADPKTKHAIEGVTVAAHPKYKFGSAVYIPSLKNKIGDGNFIVQDRGSAVTSKRAAKGKGCYAFDVYVKSHTTLKQMAETMPMWMDVHVYE